MYKTLNIVSLYILFSAMFSSLLADDKKPLAYIDGNRGWLDNGVVRLAVDKDFGGAIVYASAFGGKENMVNINDLGREIQQSYYAGESLNRQKDGQSKSWSPWSWNPVQAGNTDRDKSIILNFETQQNGTVLYTKCQP